MRYSDFKLAEDRVEYSNAPGDMQQRPYAVDPKLIDIIDRAAEAVGVTVRITSGGQDQAHVKGGSRVKSNTTRHDLGQAADVILTTEDGRDVLAKSDLAKDFIRQCGMHGAREVGYGYKGMGNYAIHIGLSGVDNVNARGQSPNFGDPDSTGGQAWGSDDARDQGFDALRQGITDRWGGGGYT